jgi:hypothetical protein
MVAFVLSSMDLAKHLVQSLVPEYCLKKNVSRRLQVLHNGSERIPFTLLTTLWDKSDGF